MKRKTMDRKWKDNRGETLIEVLASILVGTLSVALLFGAVMASAKMDRTAKDADAAFTESVKLAETQKSPATDIDKGTTGEGIVTVKNKSNDSGEPLTVVFYGDKQLLSYKLKNTDTTVGESP